jgi:hypothetical protein
MQCFLGCSSLPLYGVAPVNGLITQRSVVVVSENSIVPSGPVENGSVQSDPYEEYPFWFSNQFPAR